MGCDIHAFLEFYETGPNGSCLTQCLCEDINFGRSYNLFSLMAGVRGCCSPVVPPKGIPTNPELSLISSSHYYLSVVDSPHPGMGYSYTKNTISREEAEELIKNRKSYYSNPNKTLIADPDLHTPSWLTLDELLLLRKEFLIYSMDFSATLTKKRKNEALRLLHTLSPLELMQHSFSDIEYIQVNAVIASMMAIERSGNYKTRLVFWFDS